LAYEFAFANKLKSRKFFSKKRKRAGKDWAKGFLERHPNIKETIAKSLSAARAIAANPQQVRAWFKVYENLRNKLHITDPRNIWNFDETGVQDIPKDQLVWAENGKTCYHIVSGEKGETSTIVGWCNAAGEVIPPLIIHKGQRVPLHWEAEKPGGCYCRATETGYINKDKLYEYGKAFIRFLKYNNRLGSPHIVLMDGHSSHVYNTPFYELMRENNVYLICIPAHTTHVLQPLDLFPFALFKKFWEWYLDNWNFKNAGQKLPKKKFWDVFWPAWKRGMTKKAIFRAFFDTGLNPVEVENVNWAKLDPSKVTEEEERDPEGYSKLPLFLFRSSVCFTC